MLPIERPASLFATPPVWGSLAVLMSVALSFDQTALAVLCAGSLCVIGVARAWSTWSLSRLHAHLQLERWRAFPDEALSVRVGVENRKWLPVWLQVHVPLSAALAEPAHSALSADTGLQAQQRVSFRFALRARSRGVHALGPCVLRASDPLGLFPKQRAEQRVQELIVYPRLVELAALSLPRRDSFGRPGAHNPVVDPAYIHGVREYQAGRPARLIHWKASARHGRLLEKVCEPGERERVLLLVAADDFQPEAFERCLEVVASIAVELLRRGSAVGLLSNARMHGDVHAVRRVSAHPSHVAQLLEALARMQPSAAGPLRPLLDGARVLTLGTSVLAFGHDVDANVGDIRALCEDRRIPVLCVECVQGSELATAPSERVGASTPLRALRAASGAKS